MMRVSAIQVSLQRGRCWGRIEDWVSEDIEFSILVDGRPYTTLTCSPKQLRELAIGHLYTRGVLRSIQEVQDIHVAGKGPRRICRLNLKAGVNVETGPERLVFRDSPIPPPNGPVISPETIYRSVEGLSEMAEEFRRTGGVHVAAIHAVGGGLVTYAEDVGRHNAVDKVVGYGVLNGVDFKGCFLVLSGRLSGEIVQKAGVAGISILASPSAATGSGVRAALQMGITLIAFVRDGRMNIYTFPERVRLRKP